MSKTIKGFDYRCGREVEHERAEWRRQMYAVVGAGGFRRAEQGETFAHNAKGELLFEVYAIIPA